MEIPLLPLPIRCREYMKDSDAYFFHNIVKGRGERVGRKMFKIGDFS